MKQPKTTIEGKLIIVARAFVFLHYTHGRTSLSHLHFPALPSLLDFRSRGSVWRGVEAGRSGRFRSPAR